MTAPISFDCRRSALFLDFDGTLVEIAARPDNVVLRPRTRELLEALGELTAGAVAIVSGRPLAEIDAFLAPLDLPAAGSHGAELRGRSAAQPIYAEGVEHLETVREPIRRFAERHGLLAEEKVGAISLHYRSHPEHGPEALALCLELARDDAEFRVIDGDMVVEVALAGVDKGYALEHLLEQPAFADRVPVAVGDDATDEDAFRAALRLGGQALKVGKGPTAAQHRLSDVEAVHRWLECIIRDAGGAV